MARAPEGQDVGEVRGVDDGVEVVSDVFGDEAKARKRRQGDGALERAQRGAGVEGRYGLFLNVSPALASDARARTLVWRGRMRSRRS